jgi:uncharacterized membrane protein YdjX (TVP38/TMEM64 family)
VRSGISLSEVVVTTQQLIKKYGMWGPALYIVLYSFRSLIFFPASLLTGISGLIFGPWYGLLFTIIGENISGNISFVVGRYFGSDAMKRFFSKYKVAPSLECKLRENGFLAVLSMRLMYLPFDLVGYMSGVCNIPHRHFALGTFIGTIPGLMSFVLLGSAIANPRNLFLALPFFIFGWTLSKWIKKNKHHRSLVSG